MAKRASTSSSSGEPSQPKRPYLAPTGQVWSGSERNLVPGSCSTEEDGQRVCGEEPGLAKSHSVEYCQSCTGSALKDMVQRMHSMENSISKLFRKELELVQSHIVKQFREELELVKSYFARQVKEVVPEISSVLEDTSRRVVREELEHANSQSAQPVRSSGKCGKKDEVRNLKLRFKTRLSLPLFTGQKLEGEQGAAIVVELINANTGDIVESGPESSVKLDVVVLDGGFKREDDDYWTQEEFEKNVVKEREGKRPLLTGNLEVVLKEGTGVLGELEFTDNSCWIRSKKFRLGLRLSPGYCENIRVCEAKTEAFTVKEHRGESYKKHYPPASDDEVWRLANIAKDGPSHKKLNEAGIYKVDEFLRQHSMDSKKLRNILGKGMTDKKWKVLLDHAKTCTLDGKFYVYYRGNESDHGVIINNVGQLCGLTANGVFRAIDRFSLQNTDYADRLVKKACENWNDVRQFDPEASSDSMPEEISCSFLSAALGDQQCCHPVQDNMPPPRLASQVGLNVPPITSASTGEEKNGITVAQLPIQSQSLNSQHATWNPTIDRLNQMEPSTNTNVQSSGSFPGNSGIPAAPLAIQSQSLNSQNATWNRISDSLNQMEPSTDTNVQPSASFPGNSGITAARLPIQSQSPNSQHATWNPIIDSWNQMEPSTDANVQPSESFPGKSVITIAELPIQWQSRNSQQATWNPIIDSLDQMEPSADTNIQQFGSFPGNSGIPPVALSPGNSGIPATSWEIQSQSLNSQNAPWNQMEPLIDSNVQPYGRFPGNSGIVAAGLPIQLHNQIIDSSNQKEPSADINVQPFGQPYGPPSSFLASNTEDDWINRLTRND